MYCETQFFSNSCKSLMQNVKLLDSNERLEKAMLFIYLIVFPIFKIADLYRNIIYRKEIRHFKN